MTISADTIRPRVAALLMLLIVTAGLVLRVWNINFDQGIGSHPDERSTACSYAPSIALPASWQEFVDPKQSPLNPLWDRNSQQRRSFTYGHFPLYLGVLMGEALHSLAPLASQLGLPEERVLLMERANQPCGGVAVAGRLVIALLDTLTIILLYFLGKQLYGRGGGLLAATLYAFTAQAIQLSHFFAMDPASTTFTVLAIWGAVVMVQDRSWRGVLITGIGAGLAIASKFSALPILAAPVVAAFCILFQENRRAQAEDRPADGHAQMVAIAGVGIALILAALVFLVTSPYAVLDYENFLQATLVEQGRMVRGIADMPFTRQYRNTTPYVYFIEQQVQWGMGPALGMVALAGVAWALWRLLLTLAQIMRGRLLPDDRIGELLAWSWLVPYFGLTGAFLAKFNRYMSPVLPFMLLFAAGMIVWLIQHRRALPRISGYLLGVLAVLGSIFWSLAFVNGVHGREHTWIEASRWVYENAPRDSRILWEVWDDPLPKEIRGEAGMNMHATGLTNIDWVPYEEDTAEKYEIMKARLREADFVAYSSKRIYDSVDELPARYPMTNLYYDAMWDGRLGFELAYEAVTSPRLFGFVFEDRDADESWSLYDHPQVTIFRKVRDLSDAEFDAIFDHIWEQAVPWDRGAGSRLDPLLDMVGLGDSEASASEGILSRVIALVTGSSAAGSDAPPAADALMLDTPLRDLPVVDNYRWNVSVSERASNQPWQAALVWWGATLLLAVLAFPLAFAIFRPLRDRGWIFARMLGWLLAGWALWILASARLLTFSVRNTWLMVCALAAVSLIAAWRQRHALAAFLRANWQLLLASEVLFAVAYVGFVGIRMLNPDLWQPWYGGEKFMEMAFLNGILRSPWFPPVDPHFAGGYINYYYFGLYLVAYLIKLTGIYAEVAFNLAIPTLFALTVTHAFGVAYSAVPETWRAQGWRRGFGVALLAPLFVAVIGNLDGFAQIVRNFAAVSSSTFQSGLPGLQSIVRGTSGFVAYLRGDIGLPGYNFWDPSRVIPATINEFPWWSFLYADLHPHLIGIPLAIFFLGLVYALLRSGTTDWLEHRLYGAGLLAAFALALGALASINLWELPTYLALGVLTLLLSQYWGRGRVHLWWTLALSALYGGLAWFFFLPFFANYVNVGASGVGFVREGDDLGLWLLIWGFLGFVVVSWLLWSAARPARPLLRDGAFVKPDGFERGFSLAFRYFDRLPRVAYLERLLDNRATLGYRLLATLLPLTLVAVVGAWWFERTVLALCLIFVTLAFLLLWRRGRAADAGTQFGVLLAVTGFAILAGTQMVYLKDWLSGGDWYRMNTLFKFFSQVWVLFGVTAAIGAARLWTGFVRRERVVSDQLSVISDQSSGTREQSSESRDQSSVISDQLSDDASIAALDDTPVITQSLITDHSITDHSRAGKAWRYAWAAAFVLLLAASLAYTFVGTPVRLKERMVGWRPAIGTLDGLDFMNQGTYAWPDGNNIIELQYDRAAIDWLLARVRGNAVVAESSELDYYRAGSSRIASQTGLSGLNGMHEGEQRYGEHVGARAAMQRELWSTPDNTRLLQLLDELNVDLIYVGQLETFLHPATTERLAALAAEGILQEIYSNPETRIYAVSGRLALNAEGQYAPVPSATSEEAAP